MNTGIGGAAYGFIIVLNNGKSYNVCFEEEINKNLWLHAFNEAREGRASMRSPLSTNCK